MVQFRRFWKVGGGSFWDVTRRAIHVSAASSRSFSPVRDVLDEVMKTVPTSKIVDVVAGDRRW